MSRLQFDDTTKGLLLEAKNLLENGHQHRAVKSTQAACVHIIRSRGKTQKTAKYLNEIGRWFKENLVYVVAEVFYREALNIRRSTTDSNDELLAVSVNNLGLLYEKMGKYKRSEQYLKEAVILTARTLGKASTKYADALNNLGMLRQRLGKLVKAKENLTKSRDIRKLFREELPLKLAQASDNLGLVHHRLGELRRAEELHAEALELARGYTSDNDNLVAVYLTHLGAISRKLAHYDQARDQLSRSEKIFRANKPTDNAGLAACLHNKAVLHKALNEYDCAEKCLIEAANIRQNTLKDVRETASTFREIAELSYLRGHFLTARESFSRVLKVFESEYGKAHSLCAHIHNSVAGIDIAEGEWTRALRGFELARQIRIESFGQNHLEVAESLSGMARAYAGQKQYHQAIDAILKAAWIYDEYIDQAIAMSSEEGSADYLDKVRLTTDLLMSLLVTVKPSYEKVLAGLNFILRRKGLRLEASIAQLSTIRRSPTEDANYIRLLNITRELRQLSVDGPVGEEVDLHSERIRMLKQEQGILEKALAGNLGEMEFALALRQSNLKSILDSKHVLPNTALVEIIVFRMVNLSAVRSKGERLYGSARYAGFVVETGNPFKLNLIDFGIADDIDEAVASSLRSITVNTTRGRGYRDLAAEVGDVGVDKREFLTRSLFEPIRRNIGNCRRITLCPDGELSLLPLQILPLGNGKYVIDDYTISYLTTLRDLLRPTQHNLAARPSLVIAAPDYDLSVHPVTSYQAGYMSSFHSSDLHRAGFPFAALSGTKIEGLSVANLLGVEALTHQRALERTLKNSCPPRILHIATHGFFLDNPESSIDNQGRLSKLANLESPLQRSGLILAGANTWNRKGVLPAEAEDGVLSGQDVATLDLSSTDLVVLSACDTAIGDVCKGEGVYGLRSAFKLAGARTLVMSLWKVADTETSLLMIDFYTRLKNKTPRIEALRQAQLMIKKKHPNPVYWGAFICEGEDGPISGMANQ